MALPIRVSAAYNYDWSGVNSTSMQTSGTFALAADNTVVLMVTNLDAGTISTVTDLASNSYVYVGGFTDPSGFKQFIYVCTKANPHAANVISVTWTSAVRYRALAAIQYSFGGAAGLVEAFSAIGTGAVQGAGREVTVPAFATLVPDAVMVIMPRFGITGTYTYMPDVSGGTPTNLVNGEIHWGELFLAAPRPSATYAYRQSNTNSTFDGLAVICVRGAALITAGSRAFTPNVFYDLNVTAPFVAAASTVFIPESVGGRVGVLSRTLPNTTIASTGTITPFNNTALTRTLPNTTIASAGTVSPAPYPAMYRVQGISGAASMVGSITLTFLDPPTVGNGIVVAVGSQRNANFQDLNKDWSVTDNRGNIYYSAIALSTANKIWYCPKLTASGAPFTITIVTDPSWYTPVGDFYLFASAIEVAGVGTGLGVNQVKYSASGTSGNITTGLTAPLTANEIFLCACQVFNTSDNAANTVTVESLTPAWIEEFEQVTAGSPKGEIDTRAIRAASGTTVEAKWTWVTVFANHSSILVAFHNNAAPPEVFERVSQVAVELLRAPQPVEGYLSQAAVELLRASVPGGGAISQAALEVLFPAQVAGAAVAQTSVEVLRQIPGMQGDSAGVSHVVLEILCTAVGLTAPNMSSATAIEIPTLPVEVIQDVSGPLPSIFLRGSPPSTLIFDPDAEPPALCEVRGPAPEPQRVRHRRLEARFRENQAAIATPKSGEPVYWFKYVGSAEDNGWASVWIRSYDPYTEGSWKPQIYVYGPDSLIQYISWQANYGPRFFKTTVGATYYIAVMVYPQWPIKRFQISIVPAPNQPAPAESPAVNDDGGFEWPLVVYDKDTGKVLQLRVPFPDGEWAAVLPNGISCWSSYDGGIHLYSADMVPIAALYPTSGVGYHNPVSSNRNDAFYCTERVGGSYYVFKVSQTGVRGPTTWGPISTQVTSFGISADEHYAYWSDNTDAINRFDLTTNTGGPPLIPGALGQISVEILTLSDGSVVAGYDDYLGSKRVVAVRFNPTNGAVLKVFDLGDSLSTVSIDGLADGADGMTFWVWMYLQAPNQGDGGRGGFIHIDAVTGNVLHYIEGTQFSGGDSETVSNDGVKEDPDRFGHAYSCPFVVLRQPVPAVPTEGPPVEIPAQAVLTQTVVEVFGQETADGDGGPGPGPGGTAPGVWHEFLICGHALKAIDSWYIGGVRQPQSSAEGDPATSAYFLIPGYSAWDAAFPVTAREGTPRTVAPRTVTRNGSVYSVIWVLGGAHSPLNMVDIVEGKTPLTLNVQGIEDIGDGTGTLITKSFDIYKHCMQNWVFGDYQTGSWLPTETFIDGVPVMQESSFASCHALSSLRLAGGYVGAGAIGAEGAFISIRDLIRQLNVSFDCDSGLNRFCQFFVSMVDDQGPGLLLPTLTDVEDILQGSLEIEDDFSNHFNALWYLYQKDYVEGRNPGWRTQRKVRSEEAIINYLEELLMDSQEYWFTRDKPTADDIAQRKLLRHKDPPRLVRFALASRGFNVELGDMRNIRHFGGIGADGWLRQPVRLHRHIASAQQHRVELEGYDMARLWTGTFILGDETVLPPLWPDADPTERVYGYLGDETTSAFSSGEAIKRLR